MRGNEEMRFFNEKILNALYLSAVLIVIYFGVRWKLHDLYALDDGYAVWLAANLVKYYMREHDGEWPRSWEDLRDLYSIHGGGDGEWTFEKYQSRVFIDFTADPIKLRELSLQPGEVKFNVIRARWTGGEIGEGPNVIIRDHLRYK